MNESTLSLAYPRPDVALITFEQPEIRNALDFDSLEHLREVLADLDARQAQVFCLACLDGLSYQEIAEQLGVTVNHVGVLLNRARATLRERLRAHGPTPTAEHFPQELES